MNEFLRKILALPEQGSTVARDIDILHYWVIGITMLGATVVFVLGFIFIVRYRRRSESDLTPKVTASTAFEVVWIGGLLALFIGWWVVGFNRYLQVQTPPENSMEVYVTGKQWMWKFAYPDGRSAISVLTVPSGRPVKLLMTSRDVIHSFFVPAFRIKQDVLPGRYTVAWFQADKPGVFQILCTEYCGVAHSNMRGEVVVLSPADYQNWLEGAEPEALAQAEQALTADPEAALPPAAFTDTLRAGFPSGPTAEVADWGREVAVREGCLNCHTVDGRRHIGPTWQGLYGGSVVLRDGSRVRADPAYLTQSMMEPMEMVVQGFEPIMPSYMGRLRAPDAAAVVEFIRTLRLPAEGLGPPLPPLPQGAPQGGAGLPSAAPPGEGDGSATAAEPALGGLAARGREIAERSGCMACHTSDGTPTTGPTWQGLFGSTVRLESGQTVRADEDYITESIRDPNAQLVEGYGPLMPTYHGVLQPEEISALVEYIKALGAGPGPDAPARPAQGSGG